MTVWAEHDSQKSLLRVGVTDDGPGMTDEARKRCLDPFFSTKTRGISTGLGLTFVQGVVKQAGGSIELQSKPGKGTTFTLWLPEFVPSQRPGSDGNPRRAVLSIQNPRTRGFVAEAVRQAGFEPSYADEPSDAALWVVDSGSQVPKRVAAFVKGGSNRAVLVVGEGAKQRGRGANSARIVQVGLRPSSVRQGVEQIEQGLKAADSEGANGGNTRKGHVR